MKMIVNSNIGKRRQSNQDYAETASNNWGQHLLVLCDGVGGSKAGDIASQMTTEYLIAQFLAKETAFADDDVLNWLYQQVEGVNQYLFEQSLTNQDLFGMSTTLVIALMTDDKVYIGYVGDSRAYLYKDGQLRQLTEDHSLVNELIKSGEITPQEGETHPQRNVVTQSVGGMPQVSPDFVEVDRDAWEILLLCSDGLSAMVSTDQIEQLIKDHADDLQQLSEQLIHAANLHGGVDNITVILTQNPAVHREEEA